MSEFVLKWRFADPDCNIVPSDHLELIQPFDDRSAGLIERFIIDSGVHGDYPFKPGFFRHHETTEIGDSHGDADEDQRIRKWLYRCAIPIDCSILLSWSETRAITTTWKMLVKYWTSFYYPFSDDLTVIDRSLSLEWCLLFHHEHELHFGTNRPRSAVE